MKKFFRLVSMLAVAGLTFAYTSCTDYSEDINKVDGRVDNLQSQFDAFKSATNESIKKIDGLIADLQKTVATLETKEDHKKDVDALNKLIDGLKSDATALAGRVTAIEKDLPNYVKKTDFEETLKGYVKVADYNKTIGEITGRLDVIEGKLNPLAAKYDSELKISEIISKIDAVKATADDASQKVGVLRTDVDVLQKALEGYTSAGAIKTKFEAVDAEVAKKLNIADFKTELDKYFQGEFDEAFKAAIKISCENKDGEVYKAIYAALNPAVTALETKISNLDTKINDVLGIVLNRIQSIVFVPEYDDMNATLHYYHIGTTLASGTAKEKIVDATFEIYPAKLAKSIKKEDVSVVAVAVGTRANAAVEGEIVAFDVQDNGRVNVSVKFGKDVNFDLAKKDKVQFAISLRVKEDTKTTIDGKEVETGNYVESAFVGAKYCPDSDLTGKFGIVKLSSQTEIKPSELSTEKQWSDAPAAWNPFDGYEFAVKVDAKWLSLEEAAKVFFVDVKNITPSIKNTASFAPANDRKEFFVYAATGKDKSLADFNTEMVGEKVKANLAKAVGSVCMNKVEATVLGSKFFDKTISYKIVRRRFVMQIEPAQVKWSYANAVKLSSAKTTTAAYDKPIDGAFDKQFKELFVTIPDKEKYKDLNIEDVVTGITPTTEHKLNGAAAPAGLALKVDPVAVIKDHIARVEVTGYAFGKAGKENKYEFHNVYANDPTFTDVDVTFTLTLGPLPNPAKVNVTEQKIAYEPAVVLHEVAETETINRAFEQETVKDFFKDLAEFKADLLTGAETIVKSQRTSVKPAVNCSAYTYFRVTDRVLASTPYIRLSQADLTSYNDTYAFETKVDTWYGVAYSFATTASLVKPVYSLIYHEDLVDMTQEIPTVKIAGTKASGTYEINTDDLSKYFGVEKCNASVANYLKIKYEYVTPLANAEWINKGYENIPAIPAELDGAAGDIMADGSLAVRDIVWGNFTARDMVVKAILSCNGVEVNSLNLKLTIEDPIAEVSIEDIAVKRDPYADVHVNLWKTTTVKSILSDANQVDQTAATKAAMWKWNADVAYGLDLTYDTKYTVFVNGKDVTSQFPASKLEFRPADGVIIYHKDAAHQVNDVIVELTAHLTHKFNYNNKNAEEIHKDTYKFRVVISE
mgnify:FL=1